MRLKSLSVLLSYLRHWQTARLDDNAAAAKVPSMTESIVTYNPNLSSPTSKFASAANEFDEVEASRDELVSGGSGPVCCKP